MLQALIDVILPVFLVIGAGYATTRAGFFTYAHIDGIMKFTQGFAIPCLLFAAIANLDLGASFNPRLLISFYTGSAACFVLGILGARTLFKRDWEDSVAIGFCCLFANTVLLGLPITERAYGPENLVGNFAIVALHSPFCYGLGITTMEIVRNRGKSGGELITAVGKAMFSNTLILGIALGFLFNITGWSLPGAIDDALSLIIAAALPGALFALGGVLVQYRPEGDLRTIFMVCAISLLIHPAIAWGMGTSLDVPDDLFRSAVLTAAMAPGFNAYIFANIYGRARRVAASSVLIATVLSIVTIWGWLALLG
ncbi:AEC family transporter [Aestuariivita boseongensis]|uniref:AEC family transporter n=1 Tax=Aestuariivita boseongensis TaxID=1470562 RepID=UPI00067FC281|nr:AEC family transporter [Aestuariivita boseongensis]